VSVEHAERLKHPGGASMLAAIRRLTLLAGFLFIASLLGGALAQSPASAPLTAQEKRGKQIYLRASSASGKPITAYLGDPPIEVPPSALTCAGCHGLDGQGKPEGGVVPSNITWNSLAKPYGEVTASSRKHPRYTERAIEIAITKGLDPAGNRLGAAMPRFDMAPDDLADLIAYLKRVESDLDPGISPASLRIGTFIPADGAMAEAGEAAAALLTAYFDEVNSQGGVYNRRLELRIARLPNDRAAERVERFIKDEQVFACAASFIAGSEHAMASLMESEETPLIAPLTLLPETGFPLNRRVFYLYAGLSEQSRVLMHFAKQKSRSDARFALIAPTAELSRALVADIEDESKKLGVSLSRKIDYASARFDAALVARQLSGSGIDAILFLGSSAEAKALLDEADKLGVSFDLFLPGAFAGRELFVAPRRFEKHIFLAFPTLPTDQNKLTLLELSALAERHQLSTKHLAVLISAFSAARLLVEGLKVSGRDLSREKLISALEGFYKFETGLTPPITYGPNRRIGALGAYVVSLDLENRGFTPVSDWLALD
jgi:ABC-type branched-subunit amino acid transport system substrate-binding protein